MRGRRRAPPSSKSAWSTRPPPPSGAGSVSKVGRNASMASSTTLHGAPRPRIAPRPSPSSSQQGWGDPLRRLSPFRPAQLSGWRPCTTRPTSSCARRQHSRARRPLRPRPGRLCHCPCRQRGWCCSVEAASAVRHHYLVIDSDFVSRCCVLCEVRDFPPCQRWEDHFNTNSTICRYIFK
jgi:hypothetical protein